MEGGRVENIASYRIIILSLALSSFITFVLMLSCQIPEMLLAKVEGEGEKSGGEKGHKRKGSGRRKHPCHQSPSKS